MNNYRKVAATYFKNYCVAVILIFYGVTCISCKKEVPPVFIPKKVVYLIKGTKFRLNYIDSNSVFQKDKIYKDSFRYEFTKGPGASIGISIFRFSPSDSIYSWELFLDGQLFGNAFSEGGIYTTVPYN